MKKQGSIHYAWVVVLCCVMMSFTSMIANAACGNFTTPVVQELGCSVSSFTLFISIQAGSMALMYPIAAKVLTTKPIGKVVTAALLLQLVALGLMGTYHSVYSFYLSGVLSGVGSAFSYLIALPIIINMWFKEKAGLALGIVTSFGSTFGILSSLLSAQLIVHVGWRNAYFILALCGMVSLPVVFFLLKTPEEKKTLPYGSEQPREGGTAPASAEWGLTRKQAFRHPMFYLAWLTCLCYSLGSGVPSYSATFATMELGQSIQFGSYAAVCVSLGMIACGFILGFINDRFGARAGMIWGAAFNVAGFSVMMLAIRSPMLVLPGCILLGLGGSMYTVQAPLVARSVLGPKHYSEIWSVMMIGNSLMGAFSFGPIGLFYDKTGSYRGAFIMAMAVFTAAVFVGSAALSLSKKYRREHGTA
ncbi:MFS transporter [Anaerofilum sp. BX8]|uniref:MFS transporter n=1 Tax=Anaerofilum hominis TaxID=2763016 RepID=A0A923IAQ9_9FIRM|nr:MFS transporter [Anaerofilum hominis]MBC5581398.1 MFS transporter [Anaerofilum hominis]